jgi:hypothetical protein
MASKNALMVEDAKLVESGFEQKMLELTAADAAASLSPSAQSRNEQGGVGSGPTVELHQPVAVGPSRAERIDKGALTIAAPRRLRNKEHLRRVAHAPSAAK